MKDHEIARLVNDLTEIAERYNGTQQLSQHISNAVCNALPRAGNPAMIWNRLSNEANICKRTWGMGFPVISTYLLREYWHEATGHLPDDD